MCRCDLLGQSAGQTLPHGLEPRVSLRRQLRHHFANLALHGLHGGATVTTHFAIQQIRRLNTVGALVDRRDADITQVLCRACLLDVAHAAVNLNPQRGDLHTQLGQPALDNGNHEINAPLTRLAGIFGSGMREIHRDRLGIGQCAHGFVQRPHGQQHALHISVLNDRHAALNALTGIGHRLLIRAL